MSRLDKVDCYARDDEQKRRWSLAASALIKSRLVLARMSYRDLQHALAGMGYVQHANTIATKLSRGGYSAAFFLMCLHATGTTTIDLPRD